MAEVAVSPTTAPPDLPPDLRAAYDAAAELLTLTESALILVDGDRDDLPVELGYLCGRERYEEAGLLVEELQSRRETVGPVIEKVSGEITAACRDPVPIDSSLEVQPNAHHAALACAGLVIGAFYTNLSFLMPHRYGCKVPEGALRPRLRRWDIYRYCEELALCLKEIRWPDWEELRGMLAAEAVKTAKARRARTAASPPQPHGGVRPPRRLAARPDKKREERDRWLYQQRNRGKKTLKEIRVELNRLAPQNGWDDLRSVQAIQQAVARYARRHGITLSPKPS